MLKKRKYQKWAREEQEQEKVDLKEVEKPMPALKKVERVRSRSYLNLATKDRSLPRKVEYTLDTKISLLFFFSL